MQGPLPTCAPLALAYVPMQQSSEPAYDPDDALKRGTLFPGLDLPFMNMVNTAELSGTPLGELMAVQFVCHELHLYLDTHPQDTEAFQTLKKNAGALLRGKSAIHREIWAAVPRGSGKEQDVRLDRRPLAVDDAEIRRRREYVCL